MRLHRVKHGHAFKERVILGMLTLMARTRVPDVMRTLLYRPDFLGRPMGPIIQKVMRGPSAWSVGERELFAAFVSRLNQCPF